MDLAQFEKEAHKVATTLIADRAKVDLYYLCKYVLGYGDILDPKVHGPLCRAVRPLLFYNQPDAEIPEFPSDYGREEHEGLPNEAEKQKFWEEQSKFEPDDTDMHAVGDKLVRDLTSLLCLMPRGTLKSSVVTMGFAIQWLLNFPDDRVLIDSETFSKSTAFLTEIRGHYEDNDELRKVFEHIYGVMPDANHRKDTWADRAINLACRSRKRKEESISCAGIDVTKNGMHYDLVIMDDLHSEKNTKNADQIEQVKEHYRLVYSLLDPGKPAIVIGTRWDYNDLYQMIIDEEQEEFNFITRKAQAEDGSLLYPKRLNETELAKFRRKQGPYIYSCQYLNNPVDDETAEFKRSYFHYVTPKEIASKPILWYGMVDPSEGGPSSDYVSIIVGGMDEKGEIYYRWGLKEKMQRSQIFEKMYYLDALFGDIRLWGIEVVAQKSIEHGMEQAQRDRMQKGLKPLQIKYIKARSKEKEERIRGLVPYYEYGRAHHVQGAHHVDKLEMELLKFPKSKHDDMSDNFANLLEIGSPASHHIQSKEDNDKRKRRLEVLNKPRSPMIGY